ncbi:myohemerythrin [Lingula anatina]|uniref:Myohemerythrin n=1 Tax=Lingula anatina TaxID=7574 RepID=A0A1S3JRW0_LINAN|nr:myohemerythrin [Lingula anatina]|eukprot:XP_013413158.1 myohemerythrin [Lingula anatina]
MPPPGPHAMPEPYVWDRTFRTFYDKIDEQHMALFVGLFNVAESNLDEDVELAVKVFTKHFHDEEEMMKAANYENYEEHVKIHKAFLDDMKLWQSPVAGSTIAIAKDWLVNHIKIQDFKYKGKL